jgi:hypothetical protein
MDITLNELTYFLAVESRDISSYIYDLFKYCSSFFLTWEKAILRY